MVYRFQNAKLAKKNDIAAIDMGFLGASAHPTAEKVKEIRFFAYGFAM